VSTPSIVTLAALAVVVSTAALGVWQMQRAAEKSAAQQAEDASLAVPPVPLGAAPIVAEALAGRRVELFGLFEPVGTVLLDNRTHRGIGWHGS
jgi:cytochrome oxidase assembly protein ShyY1